MEDRGTPAWIEVTGCGYYTEGVASYVAEILVRGSAAALIEQLAELEVARSAVFLPRTDTFFTGLERQDNLATPDQELVAVQGDDLGQLVFAVSNLSRPGELAIRPLQLIFEVNQDSLAQARQAAVRDARSHGLCVAESLGCTLGGPLAIEELPEGSPAPYPVDNSLWYDGLRREAVCRVLRGVGVREVGPLGWGKSLGFSRTVRIQYRVRFRLLTAE